VDRFSPRSLGLRLRLGRRRFLALILEEEEEGSGWFGRSLSLRLRLGLGRKRFLALILEEEEEEGAGGLDALLIGWGVLRFLRELLKFKRLF
jgi:hypothetical protein